MPKINFNKQLNQITQKTDSIIKETALSFHSSIVTAWPVDSGTSRNAWTLPIQVDGGYALYNNVQYSPVLWRGLHVVGGKTYGSGQMPAGGVPIFNLHIAMMNAKFSRM